MGLVLQERDAELALLASALDDALSGRGRGLLVEGAAGIGKTALLNELTANARGRARVLRARGGEQEQQIPLLVTRELFTPYVAQASDAQLDKAFAGAAGLAGPLLGRGTAAADSLDVGFALAHGLYWLVANLADDQPLVLVVDDAHWADDATQRWLAYLLPRLGELPVLLALAARPRELIPTAPVALGLAAADMVHVRPDTLSEIAAARLVRAVLPGATDSFCAAACRATGGNPLLLRSLAAEVRHVGVRPTAEAVEGLVQSGEVGLGRIVLPRLHALGPHAVSLARAVALLGDGCSLTDAAAVAGLDAEEAAYALDGLVARELLRPERRPAFVHPLVRAIVTGELSPGERSRSHRQAAIGLHQRGADPEQVGRHLAATEPIGEPWVLDTLLNAAALATSRGAPEAAIPHLVALLREDMDPGLRSLVLLDAGWQAFRCHDARGRGWLEEALATASDPRTAVLAWMAVWNWKLILRDGHDPGTVFDGLPEDLEGDLVLPVLGNFTLDFGFTGAGLRGKVDRYPGPATDPDGTTMFERLWLSSQAIHEAMTGGNRARALACADRAYGDGQLLDEAGDFANLAWTLVARVCTGELLASQRQAEDALEHSRQHGSQLSAEWYLLSLGLIQLARGEVRAAEAILSDWLDHPPELRAKVVEPSIAGLLMLTHLERGRPEAAVGVLAHYGYLDHDPPADFHGATLLNMRGQLHLATGRIEQAMRDFRASERQSASFGCRDTTFSPWRVGAATCSALLGRRDEALVHAQEQVQIARAWEAAPLLGVSLRTLALVTGGDAAVPLAQEAVDVLAQSEAQGEHARALLELGRLLRLARHPADAHGPLQEALDLAERQGAVLLARHTEEELRLAGARPRRRAVSGVDALTPAELRVATLAGQGLTNPEIAQSLFVTRKTVEKHLGAAFLKLQISSRDQLPAVLSRV